MHLTDTGLSLSILFATAGKSEMEVISSNLLISDLLDTSDLEASLNPTGARMVGIPGFQLEFCP